MNWECYERSSYENAVTTIFNAALFWRCWDAQALWGEIVVLFGYTLLVLRGAVKSKTTVQHRRFYKGWYRSVLSYPPVGGFVSSPPLLVVPDLEKRPVRTYLLRRRSLLKRRSQESTVYLVEACKAENGVATYGLYETHVRA